MRNYRIITDSASDLTREQRRDNRIGMAPQYITLDGKTYQRDTVDISRDGLYAWMVENPDRFPQTSMQTVADFEDLFSQAGDAGEDVLYISLSGTLSGSCETARMAAGMVMESYPGMDIRVVDSRLVTVLEGLLVLEACRLRDAGVSLDDAERELTRIRGTGRIFFSIKDLEYLRHGGRIGKLAGVAGSLLGIRPVVGFRDGELSNEGLVRSRGKSMERVEQQFYAHIREHYTSPEEYIPAVGYGFDKEEGEMLRERVAEGLRQMGHGQSLPLYAIGSLIAIHAGPYPIGLGVLGRAKIEK